MEDFQSKYSGEQVEAILDAVANGEAGGGGGEGGITIELDPVFSASPAAKVTDDKMKVWDGKQDAIDDLQTIRDGAALGATALQTIPDDFVTEEQLGGKVDKVSGKGLSTEDFTTALKSKLEGLRNYDDTELLGAISGLQEQLNAIVGGNASGAIESFNEIVAFLEGVQDTQDLAGIIGAIEQQIAGKQDTIEDLETIRKEAEKIDEIVDEEGYIYSNGEKVDMRFTRSLLPVGTSVPANANLNTIEYLKIGKYYCSQNVDAKTVKNCPVNMAFSMEVFNPLSTNVDDETTADYTYRLRVLTPYNTGVQYMQCCRTSGTPGTWTYDSWYVTPRSKFALASSKNDGSAAIGASNKGVYIDSDGEIKAMSYTIGKSVPSSAVFTDTKVTAVANHYIPAEDETQQIDAPDGEVVIGLKRDAAGHVVGVVTTQQVAGVTEEYVADAIAAAITNTINASY